MYFFVKQNAVQGVSLADYTLGVFEWTRNCWDEIVFPGTMYYWHLLANNRSVGFWRGRTWTKIPEVQASKISSAREALDGTGMVLFGSYKKHSESDESCSLWVQQYLGPSLWAPQQCGLSRGQDHASWWQDLCPSFLAAPRSEPRWNMSMRT